MKVAVIGSRGLRVEGLEQYLPPQTSQIISGGAKGVDACARDWALAHGVPLREFLPQYEVYGRAAPLRRNLTIIRHADLVLAFWDGQSRGTKYVIENCKRLGVPCRVYLPKDLNSPLSSPAR
jgi:hypothetical protein